MTDEIDDEEANLELRRRAEELLKEKARSRRSPPAEADLRRLIHELEVHQIELELQNDELLRARNETERLLKKYSDLYDFAPVGYFTLDHESTIREANLAASQLLNVERNRLHGRSFAGFVAEVDKPAFVAFLARAFAGQARGLSQMELQTGTQNPTIVRVDGLVSEDGQECRVAVVDITERYRAEARQNQLINELHVALERVKMLSGLLPICASCKKIRDSEERWVAVEVYVRDHSEASFSHGLCPECAVRLYPDFVNKDP